MDDQCKKGVVFLLSSDDRRLYFAAQPNAGFNSDELQSIIDTNEMQLQTGNFVGALVNIFKEVGKRSEFVEPTTLPKPHYNSIATAVYSSLLLLLVSFLVM
ncbi:hypothetical protein COOONC_12872 [Cooperia oncophora]